MACPCCLPAPAVCLGDDISTANCTYTVSIHTHTMPLTLASPGNVNGASELADPGPGFAGAAVAWIGDCLTTLTQRYSHFVECRISSCAIALPTTLVPKSQDFVVAKASQGCDTAGDSAEAASGEYHISIRAATIHHFVFSGEFFGPIPRKVWLYKISVVDGVATASLTWAGNTGGPYPSTQTTLRCLPCNSASLPGGFPVICSSVGPCPHDITLDTPTISIACPP